MQFNPDSMFGLIFHNKDTGDSILKFDLHFIASGLHILTPMYMDLVNLLMQKVTIQLIWDPQNPTHTANVQAAYLGREVENM